jgi:hypothetical protein
MQHVIAILLGALLCGVTSLCLGTILLRKLLIQAERVEYFSLAFVVGSACFSQVVFFLCSISLARKGVFLAIGMLAAIAAVGLTRRTKTRQPFPSLPRRWKWLLGPPFALFGMVYLVNALAPEMSPDGSAYHLPLVARYLSAHAFKPITWNLYASLSQGIELLFLPAFSIGGASATALVHFLFLLDLTLLMICYGRRFEFPVPASVAAFLVFASPIVGWDGTSAYNDVAAATILFALFYLLQIWDQEKTPGLLLPVGILAGASYAAKYTAAIALPYALGFITWKLWRSRKALVRPILTVSALAALFIVPWMIKNALFVGNPVAPFANGLFPNQYVHVSFEKQYLSSLRYYHLTSSLQAPWELTVKGERLQGFFGPVFLLMPLALLSLRRHEGRRLLFAGIVFAFPWFFNIGTRFLIPALPPLTLALAFALAHPIALLPVIALLHAFLSWFSTPFRYFDSHAPRITSFPVRAALRIEPEEAYLARRSAGYLVDRLIEREVPPGEKVFSFDQIPEAWTTRQVLIGYYSAHNEALTDVLWTAMVPGLCPARALDLYFPPRRLRRLRAIWKGPSDTRMWQISEFKIFSENTPILPDGTWHFNADPNPWDAHFAFDNSLVTRWQSWRAATPGMFLEVGFSEPTRIDQVRLLTTTEALQSHIELQGMDADGHWHTLPVQPSISSIRVTENLREAAVRALLDCGIRYLLVSPGALGANEFYENAAAWGIQRIGESGGTRLYLLTTSPTGSLPPDSVSSTSEPAILPGAYDDTDPRIALHAPWVRDTQFQEAYRHTLTYTNIPGASIAFAFTGNSVTYVYTRGRNRGIAEVWIDDRFKARLDLYAPDTEWERQTTYDALGPGTHVIRIQVTGQRFPQASDCFVDLDAVIVE